MASVLFWLIKIDKNSSLKICMLIWRRYYSPLSLAYLPTLEEVSFLSSLFSFFLNCQFLHPSSHPTFKPFHVVLMPLLQIFVDQQTGIFLTSLLYPLPSSFPMHLPSNLVLQFIYDPKQFFLHAMPTPPKFLHYLFELIWKHSVLVFVYQTQCTSILLKI